MFSQACLVLMVRQSPLLNTRWHRICLLSCSGDGDPWFSAYGVDFSPQSPLLKTLAGIRICCVSPPNLVMPCCELNSATGISELDATRSDFTWIWTLPGSRVRSASRQVLQAIPFTAGTWYSLRLRAGLIQVKKTYDSLSLPRRTPSSLGLSKLAEDATSAVRRIASNMSGTGHGRMALSSSMDRLLAMRKESI